MAVITVTGEMGSLGGIPAIVGKFPGYRVVDRQIAHDLARRLGWSVADVETLDERVGGLLERLARSFGAPGAAQANNGFASWSVSGTSPRPSEPLRFVEGRYVTALQHQVIEYASEGDIVIVDHAAAAILAEWPSALHVRLGRSLRCACTPRCGARGAQRRGSRPRCQGVRHAARSVAPAVLRRGHSDALPLRPHAQHPAHAGHPGCRGDLPRRWCCWPTGNRRPREAPSGAAVSTTGRRTIGGRDDGRTQDQQRR